MSGREKFKKHKRVIFFMIGVLSLLGRNGNKKLLRVFRNTNGQVGVVLRYAIVKNISSSVGDNVSIQPGAFLFSVENMTFGDNVSIHPMCYLEGAGGIDIGNNVSIAHATTLISTNHTWTDSGIPIKYNPESLEKITIKDDVWVGCGVRILAGSNIETRAVIAAGAVVNGTVESNCVVGGVPFKILKKI
jgi:acetyltransferase-like isoleucine patch superfamily enzyme